MAYIKIRMGKVNYLFLIVLLGIFSIFFWSGKARAADSDVVINEVMANPLTETSGEFIELYNNGDESIDLTGWSLEDNSSKDAFVLFTKKDFGQKSGFILEPKAYALILDADYTADYDEFLQANLSTNTIILTVASATLGNGLGNPSDKITLFNQNNQIVEEFIWISDAGNNISWERIDPTVTGDDNWRPSLVSGGTPGDSNSKFVLPNYPPEVFDLVNFEDSLIRKVLVSSIVDGDTIKVSGLEGLPSYIRLLGVDSAESGETLFEPAKSYTKELSGQTIDLVIRQKPAEQLDTFGRTLAVVIVNDRVFNTELLARGLATFYDSTNTLLINDAWQAIEEEAQNKKLGFWASTAEKSIILSELLPNPIGSDEEEWIEIYNPSDNEVNLSYFLLDQYLIPFGTIIAPKSWLVFPHNQTGITLNNSGDTIRLFFPDGILIDETNFDKAKEGLAWAMFDNSWGWTEEPTPNNLNIFVSSVLEETSEEETEENIPINSEPIDIKTGDFKNYENYLVKITGTVVSTSGNTFYLDDGSGRAKVYVQAATGIDKPEMHVGDIFEVIGIVNLYRETWRILPQKQDDIKLIKALQKEDADSSTSVKKTSTAKTSTAKKSSIATVKARSPTDTSAKGIEGESQDFTTRVEAVRSPFWIQLTKAVTGLALVFLIVLIVKIIQIRKTRPEPLGGNFGDDFT